MTTTPRLLSCNAPSRPHTGIDGPNGSRRSKFGRRVAAVSPRETPGEADRPDASEGPRQSEGQPWVVSPGCPSGASPSSTMWSPPRRLRVTNSDRERASRLLPLHQPQKRLFVGTSSERNHAQPRRAKQRHSTRAGARRQEQSDRSRPDPRVHSGQGHLPLLATLCRLEDVSAEPQLFRRRSAGISLMKSGSLRCFKPIRIRASRNADSFGE